MKVNLQTTHKGPGEWGPAALHSNPVGQTSVQAAEQALILLETPQRARLRQLKHDVEELRDRIVNLDLEIEDLRATLVDFEVYYESALREEHQVLGRVSAIARQMERWSELLSQTESNDAFHKRAKKARKKYKTIIDAYKAEVESAQQLSESGRDTPDPSQEQSTQEDALDDVKSRATQLKELYRELARLFHPDLARTEEERIKAGQTMRQVNACYHAGDLERLELLLKQSKGANIDEPDLSVDEQLELLTERHAWFEEVLANLEDEQHDLKASETCQLLREFEQAENDGRDPLETLKEELGEEIEASYEAMGKQIKMLEEDTAQFNRRHTLSKDAKRVALDRFFNPFGNKKLVRMGLSQLAQGKPSAAQARYRDIIVRLAEEDLPTLTLVLLTYVSELSRHPLPGLESRNDMVLRFNTLHAEEDASFEHALVQAGEWLEYGVVQHSPKVVRMALRAFDNALLESVPYALRDPMVRRQFRNVLAILGEHTVCKSCDDEVFLIPLFQTRGLDNLRARVCPKCGHTHDRYWMPKGNDIQSVLNATYLELELIEEFTFRLSRTTVGAQLLPVELEGQTLSALKKRIYRDVFKRNDINIAAKHLLVFAGKEELSERRHLENLPSRHLRLRFSPEAPMTLADAMEQVRHRTRTRFKR